MTTTSTRIRVAVGALVLAASAVALTGCSGVGTFSGSGLDRSTVQDDVDLPSGFPDDASDIAFQTKGGDVWMSWKGSPVEGANCSADGSEVPTLPTVVQHGDDVVGDVQACDFGHQVTSDGYTYLWMTK